VGKIGWKICGKIRISRCDIPLGHENWGNFGDLMKIIIGKVKVASNMPNKKYVICGQLLVDLFIKIQIYFFF
jgi:hypothetical protein